MDLKESMEKQVIEDRIRELEENIRRVKRDLYDIDESRDFLIKLAIQYSERIDNYYYARQYILLDIFNHLKWENPCPINKAK